VSCWAAIPMGSSVIAWRAEPPSSQFKYWWLPPHH
jgi:hypothetical protein